MKGVQICIFHPKTGQNGTFKREKKIFFKSATFCQPENPEKITITMPNYAILLEKARNEPNKPDVQT
jgi:hypothetical protein